MGASAYWQTSREGKWYPPAAVLYTLRFDNNQKTILEVGAQCGFWTIVEAPNGARTRAKWKCRCACGALREVKGENLRHGLSKSCGCPKFCRLPSYLKQNREAWTAARVSSGICKCGRSTDNKGRLRCLECTSRSVKQNKRQRDIRIANNQCPQCGGQPLVGKKFCQECLYKDAADTFNISVEEVIRIRNSPCEACGKTGRNVVDHDHKTGKVRGGLCNSCNSALGFAKEDPDILQNLIAYIQHHRNAKDAT
jgi:hypothetical protein